MAYDQEHESKVVSGNEHESISVPLNDSPLVIVEAPGGPPEEEPENTGWRRYVGLTVAVISSIFFSLTVVVAKILQKMHGHHPFVIVMYRYAGIMIPAIPIVIYIQGWRGVDVFETLRSPLESTERWKNLLLYVMLGSLSCTSIIFRFLSIQYISIGDSTVVSSGATVLVVLLAYLILGEKCGLTSVVLAFITGIGVVIIARPPLITGESEFNMDFLTGTMYASLALIAIAHVLIVLRKVRKTHFALIMLFVGVWGVLESGMLALLTGKFTFPQTLTEFGLIMGLALAAFLGQITLIVAIKFEHAGPLSIARTSEAIFAFLWQFFFFGVAPDYISVIGGGLVISAVFMSGYIKYISSLASDDPLRRKLSFLLR